MQKFLLDIVPRITSGAFKQKNLLSQKQQALNRVNSLIARFGGINYIRRVIMELTAFGCKKIGVN